LCVAEGNAASHAKWRWCVIVLHHIVSCYFMLCFMSCLRSLITWHCQWNSVHFSQLQNTLYFFL
jgi:hypothetical protein